MSARAWHDARATADIRMALAPTYEGTERATAPAGPGDVWCHHCEQPAAVEVLLAVGETRAYCATHIARLTIETPLSQIAKTWEQLQ